MAKTRKQPKVELHDDSKMETVYDFGEITVPTKWDDVTLKMFQQFGKLDMEKATVIDLIAIFTGMEREKVELLPVEFSERILGNLSFIYTQMPADKPSNVVEIDGEKYCVKFQEQMGTLEMVDYEKVKNADKDDFASLLGILCRKVTGTKYVNATGQTYFDNEPYNSEFANIVFDDRKKMWEEQPITKVMPLISFFLLRHIERQGISQSFLETIDLQLRELLTNTRDFLNSGDYTGSSAKRHKRTLRKLEKSLDGLGIRRSNTSVTQ